MFSDFTLLATWISFGTFLLTAIGGYFIIKTFALQAKTMADQNEVLKIQQRMADIENERYRIEYKPKFEVSVPSITNKNINNHIQSYLHFKLKLIKNDCRNFNISGRNNASWIEKISISKNHSGLKLPFLYFYENEDYDLHITINSLAQLFPYEGGVLNFFLLFEDSIGNNYSQEFLYVFKDAILNQFEKPIERLT